MSRLWDYGDGSAASTDRNPRHTYYQRGRSTARLTLSVSANGGTSAAGTDPFQFRIQGRADDVYLIQAAPDLVNWTVIATNEAAADGTVHFSDAQARNFSQRSSRGVPLNMAATGGPRRSLGSSPYFHGLPIGHYFGLLKTTLLLQS